MRKIFCVVISLFITCPLIAQEQITKEQQLNISNMMSSNEKLAKCLAIVDRKNISSDAVKEQGRVIFQELSKNSIVVTDFLVTKAPASLSYMPEIMSTEMLSGFIMGGVIAKGNSVTDEDKERLYKKHGFDYKSVHAELWQTYKCQATFDTL